MKRKVKKDRPEVIIRLQRKEIADLMQSKKMLKEYIEAYESDTKHYKDCYNAITEERNAWRQRDWERGIVIRALIDRIRSLEDALKIPEPERSIKYDQN